MISTAYDIGDLVTLSNLFEVQDGSDVWQPADPDTVTLQITAPDGTIVSYVYGTDMELANPSTGQYTLDLALDQSGMWWYQWIGTGAATGTEPARLFVRSLPPVVTRPATRGYTTADEVASEMGLVLTASQEARCWQLITEAEAYIDRYTGRSWLGPSPTTEDVRPEGGIVRLQSYPIANVTAVTLVTREHHAVLPATTVSADEYRIVDAARGILAFAYHLEGHWLHITYTHSGDAVPVEVSRAARLWVAANLEGSSGDDEEVDPRIKSYSVGNELTVTRFDPDIAIKARYSEVDSILYSYKARHFA